MLTLFFINALLLAEETTLTCSLFVKITNEEVNHEKVFQFSVPQCGAAHWESRKQQQPFVVTQQQQQQQHHQQQQQQQSASMDNFAHATEGPATTTLYSQQGRNELNILNSNYP